MAVASKYNKKAKIVVSNNEQQEKLICENCGNSELVSKGVKKGKHLCKQYKCKACGKYSLRKISNNKNKILFCNNCKSEKLIRYGLKNKKQNYLCMNCMKYTVNILSI